MSSNCPTNYPPSRAKSCEDEESEIECLHLSDNEDDVVFLCNKGKPTPSAARYSLGTSGLGTSSSGLKQSKAQASSSSASGEAMEVDKGKMPDVAPEKKRLSLKSIPCARANNSDRVKFGHMALSDYIRQRNIKPPPNRYPHLNKGSSTGAWSKVYRSGPAQNKSLDGISKMTRSANHGNQGSGQRLHFSDSGKIQHVEGVESVREAHAESNEDVFSKAELAEGQTNPWRLVEMLKDKGHNIHWYPLMLNQRAGLTEEERSRMYRYRVVYQHVEGICEGGSAMQAKHGAAISFLSKLSKAFPFFSGYKFPTQLDEALLLDPLLHSQLNDRLWESPNYGRTYNLQSEFLSGMSCDLSKAPLLLLPMYQCTLSVVGPGPQRIIYEFKRSSYLGRKWAELLAAKGAYESLLREPCPLMKPHVVL